MSTVKNNGSSEYEPLSSVWEGSDGTLLEEMFNFRAATPAAARSER